MDAEDAARLGVWLHGRAGDLAAEREGTYGLLARHLIEYLPQYEKRRRVMKHYLRICAEINLNAVAYNFKS